MRLLSLACKRGYEIAGKFPKEKVVLGRVHASLLPDEARSFAGQVAVGEAEEVIVGMAEGAIRDTARG